MSILGYVIFVSIVTFPIWSIAKIGEITETPVKVRPIFVWIIVFLFVFIASIVFFTQKSYSLIEPKKLTLVYLSNLLLEISIFLNLQTRMRAWVSIKNSGKEVRLSEIKKYSSREVAKKILRYDLLILGVVIFAILTRACKF